MPHVSLRGICVSLRANRVSPVRRAFPSLAMVVAVCVRGTVAQEDPQEYQAKARFLAITPEFVESPLSTFKTPAVPLQICVHGNFLFCTSLAELTRNATVNRVEDNLVEAREENALQGHARSAHLPVEPRDDSGHTAT